MGDASLRRAGGGGGVAAPPPVHGGLRLGYAIVLPAAQALAFCRDGLGLALLFPVASWIPSVGQWPRALVPGWIPLRRFMAFPMFATVVWLVWVPGASERCQWRRCPLAAHCWYWVG